MRVCIRNLFLCVSSTCLYTHAVIHVVSPPQLLQLNGQQHELQSNLSQLAGELSNLRDLPAQLSKLQEEHTRVSKQLTETLATLDELSLLSATEIEQKDAVLLELQMKLDEAVEANKVGETFCYILYSTTIFICHQSNKLPFSFPFHDSPLSPHNH